MYDPGLAYTTVAQTTLSRLDPTGELLIGGYPVETLAANATYEEAVFLLLEGRLPTADELDGFRSDLAAYRSLPEPVRDTLRAGADGDIEPMAALRGGLAAADLGVDGTEPREMATRVVAVVPTIVATYWRYRQDEQPIEPDPALGHVANYLWMLTGERPTTPQTDALETLCVTLLEHGLDASSFAARTTVSTDSDLVSAATAAVGALKGDRHAGRFAEAFELLTAARTAETPEPLLRDRAERGAVPGFGHPVYRTRDPRVAVLSAALERHDPDAAAEIHRTIRELESAATEVFDAATGGRGESDSIGESQRPEITVEFPATALLDSVGVPPALFAATFAVARSGGWVAHALEGRQSGPLLRPSARYVGERKSTWTPVENRHTAGDHLLSRPLRSPSLEPITETLDVLSEPSRLEILLALYDSDEPMAYSALLDATTIGDKGRFNYHLRTLREYFVSQSDDGYRLTEVGEQLVDAVVTNDRLFAE